MHPHNKTAEAERTATAGGYVKEQDERDKAGLPRRDETRIHEVL
jgi:hypothetical protein